ncbi:MAG: CsbD family protein [Veillonella sp.]|nr:CsbD family protein [Veillonella sp.]
MALEDKLNQAKGALKENAGKLTDNKELQAEGAVENTAAKVKEVKDAVDGAISGVKNVLHKDDK